MRTSPASGVRHDCAVAKRRGRRGEGTIIHSRSDGRWIARYPLGGGRFKRAKCRTSDEARRKLEGFRRDYAHGERPVSGSLDAYLATWLNTPRDIEPSTLRSYREHVDHHISPLLGGIPVAALRAADVDRLVRELMVKRSRHGRPLSPTTVARIVTTLRIALNRGVKRGELTRNVAAQAELPRRPHEPVHAMSGAEADRIIEAVEGHWAEPIVRFLLGSALRLGEAVALNQGDIADGFVRLRKSKTTLRAVPISDDAAAALRLALVRAPRVGPDEPVFFGVRNGQRLRGDAVTHALPALLVAAGLPRLTPHGLRHGAASLMVAGGIHMRTISEQLGHTSPAFTAKVYAHVIPSLQREAVDPISRSVRAVMTRRHPTPTDTSRVPIRFPAP